MDHTDHHLLVGDGAQQFARNMGFKIEADLNMDNSRRQYLEWKRRTDPGHYLNPEERLEAGIQAGLDMVAEGIIPEEEYWGTINCDGINGQGEICGVTTTSGLSWKIPGRVGDSPILGAGLYVDGTYGAAGSTGRGEANLYNLTSYLIVENLRNGMSSKDAGMAGLKRIQENTVESRLLNDEGNPSFGINFYIIDAKGEYAGVSLYESERSRYAVCTENGAELAPLEGLLQRSNG
jgi:N4-(beta-N-acetylglucosaminyl)-L-asparaginase